MTRREWQQFLDQNADGLKWANVPQNIFSTSRKETTSKTTITELRMEDETIIKNETQILDAIENYFNNL